MQKPECWSTETDGKTSYAFLIELDDNVPSYQANSKQSSHHRYKTDKLVTFQELVTLTVSQLAKTFGKCFPFTDDIQLDIYITPKNRKHGDRVNMIKGIEDALQGVLFVNDRQIKSGEVVIEDPDEPRLLIIISDN